MNSLSVFGRIATCALAERQFIGDFQDQILLASHHFAPAELEENVSRINPQLLRSPLDGLGESRKDSGESADDRDRG